MSANGRHHLKSPVRLCVFAILLMVGSVFIIVSCQNGETSADNNQNNNNGNGADAVYVDNLTQYGITWTFDKAYPTGQFVNGDYWVVGPVAIVSIDPPSVETSENIGGEMEMRTKNGSMINPDPGIGNSGFDKEAQGYDSHMWQSDHHYYPSLNVALNVSPTTPLQIDNGSSLVSTISHDDASHRPALKSAAVLTVLDQSPPEGSFRPPYAGNDKSIGHHLDDVLNNLGKLQNLSMDGLTGVPAPAVVQEWFRRPWLDHIPGHLGEYIHPSDNMPEYGGNVAERLSEAALWLHLDFSADDKSPLLKGYIQCGIDFYGIIKNAYYDSSHDKIVHWWASGGQCGGRKWPILFAGAMLGDPQMMDIVSDPDILFQEDGQTFYVDQTAIDFSGYSATMCGHNGDNLPCGGYETSMLMMPEWGIAHAANRFRDTARWETMYRQCCTAARWGGLALSAIAMDLVDEWGHNAFFDYMDRYFQFEENYNGGQYTQYITFIKEAWLQYRDDFSENWPHTDWSQFNSIVWQKY